MTITSGVLVQLKPPILTMVVTIVVAGSALAYFLCDYCQWHTMLQRQDVFSSLWGNVKVGFLVIYFLSLVLLLFVLGLQRQHLVNWPALRLFAIVLSIAAGLFYIMFLAALIRFLFP